MLNTSSKYTFYLSLILTLCIPSQTNAMSCGAIVNGESKNTELIAEFQTWQNNNLSSYNEPKINHLALVKEAKNKIELVLPGESQASQVTFYGAPYKHGEKTVIDYSVSKDGQPNTDVVLETAEVNHLRNTLRNSELSSNNFEEVFMPETAKQYFGEFISQGGSGSKIPVSNSDPSLSVYDGYFLHIKDIPNKPDADSKLKFLRDQRSLDLLNKLQAEGIELFLFDSNHMTAAAFSSSTSMAKAIANVNPNLNTRLSLMLDINANHYTLIHEVQHLKDYSGYTKELENTLIELENNNTLKDPGESGVLSAFLLEQRAYAVQSKAVSVDYNKAKAEEADYLTLGNLEDFMLIDNMKTKQNLGGLYAEPLNGILHDLSVTNPESYTKLKEVIRENTFESELIPIEELFPSHFGG